MPRSLWQTPECVLQVSIMSKQSVLWFYREGQRRKVQFDKDFSRSRLGGVEILNLGGYRAGGIIYGSSVLCGNFSIGCGHCDQGLEETLRTRKSNVRYKPVQTRQIGTTECVLCRERNIAPWSRCFPVKIPLFSPHVLCGEMDVIPHRPLSKREECQSRVCKELKNKRANGHWQFGQTRH